MTIMRELTEGLRVSCSAVWANTMRSALTVIGIVIGIVSVVLVTMAIEGIGRAFAARLAALGTDVLYVQRFPWSLGPVQRWRYRNRREITLANAREFTRQVTTAVAVAAQIDTLNTVTYRNRSGNFVIVSAVTAETAVVNSLTLSAGRFLSPAEVDGGRPVCVLGTELAERLFPNETPLGKKVRINDLPFEVVGVLEKVGQLGHVNLDLRAMVPITQVVLNPRWHSDVNILVKAGSLERMGDTYEEARGIMRKIRNLAPGAPDDFSINQQEFLLKSFGQVRMTIALVGYFLTGLALFVGGIGIMNVMFVSVVERTHEIGIRKAIGARQRTILLQFLIEAALLCFLGGLLGLGLAYPASVVMGKYLPTSLSWSIAALALLVSVITGLLSGLVPAYRAAGLRPVDALRYE